MVRLSKPELEVFLDEQVKAGRFASREAAIEAAVERMMLEDAPLDEATLDAIDEAEEQLERGAVHDWKDVSPDLRARFLNP